MANSKTIIPATETPPGVWVNILGTVFFTRLLPITVILFLISLLFKQTSEWGILHFISICITLLLVARNKEIQRYHQFTPPYHAQSVINEKTGENRMLMPGTNAVATNESPEMEGNVPRFMDLKKVLAFVSDPLSFQVGDEGTLEVKIAIALQPHITPLYSETAHNLKLFNSIDEKDLAGWVQENIISRVSSYYTPPRTMEHLLNEDAVCHAIFGKGSATQRKGMYRDIIEKLEESFGSHVSVLIVNSNPDAKLMKSRDEVARMKYYDKSMQIFIDRGMDPERAAYLVRIVSEDVKATEENSNFNVTVKGLENMTQFSMVGTPAIEKGGKK